MKIDYSFNESINSWMVVIEGEIDIYNVPQLKEDINRLLDDRKANLVLLCDHLKYIDSTGLGAFISMLKKVKEYDGNITIRNLKPYIQKIFGITGLDRVFTIEVIDS